MQSPWRSLSLCFVLFLLSPQVASASTPVVLNEDVDKFLLARHLYVLEDKEASLSLEDVLRDDVRAEFKLNKEGVENFGFVNSAFWVHFSVENPLHEDQELVLEEAYPHIDHLDVYLFRGGRQVGSFKAGDTFPFHRREVDYRSFLFELVVPAQSTMNVYIRAKTEGAAQLPLTLWRPNALLEKINKEQTFMGVYFGIMTAMALYNLFLFIFLRDRNYLYYVAFVSSMILQQLGLSRMDMEFLWPNSPAFANTSHIVIYCATFFFGALFSRSFLDTRRYAPLLNKGLLVMMAVCVLNALITIFVSRRLGGLIVLFVIAAIEPLLLLAAGIRCWSKGRTVARYYTVAWTVFLISAVFNNFRNMGVVEPTLLANYSSHIGSALEVFLLSLALADRINAIKNDAIAAKQKAFEAEKAMTTELEKQVELRTAELKDANLELEKQSNTDGLTRIFNRRYFDRQLDREWRRHKRTAHPLGLIMCDIDFFKQYNDTYGHQAGDACLQSIAGTLDASVRRSHDIVARYGGEEFVVLLPETDLHGARKVAESIRSAVYDLKIPHETSSVGGVVTLSYGVSSTAPDTGTGATALVSLADEALYLSKKHGRDCISDRCS